MLKKKKLFKTATIKKKQERKELFFPHRESNPGHGGESAGS